MRRRAKSLPHEVGGNNASPLVSPPVAVAGGGRAPLLIAAALQLTTVGPPERGGDDGLVAEAPADVVDGPAGVVPPGPRQLVETQLAGAVVDEVGDTDPEEPHPRCRVDEPEQTLGRSGDGRPVVDGGVQGRRP